jgi:hypothetical protein
MKRISIAILFPMLFGTVSAQTITIETTMISTYELDTVLPINSIHQLLDFEFNEELYPDELFVFTSLLFAKYFRYHITPTAMVLDAKWVNDVGEDTTFVSVADVIWFVQEGTQIKFSVITCATIDGEPLQVDYILDMDMNESQPGCLMVSSYQKGDKLVGTVLPRGWIENWNINYE